LFDAADLGILEGEIDVLKREIDKFDTFSDGLAPSSEEKMAAFLEDAACITSGSSEGFADIDALKSVLSDSRLASAYIECADEHGVSLVFSDQVETAIYDRSAGQILINSAINQVDQVFLAAQELRRHYQHRQGALIHPLTFHPDNAVLVNRAQNADLVVSIIRVAWELQLSGFKDAWDRVESSSMADLGRAFAREAFLDFRTINNGQASAAVFEAWFLSERCRMQDKILINQMLADHQGYVFELEQSESVMTPALIAALGAMPFGKNYLAEHALTIMEDAIFTDVRDRSNANFLWFIKFERSFRETEQGLQTSDLLPEQTGSSTAQTHNTQGQFDESIQSPTAEIISPIFGRGSVADVAEDGDKTEKSAKRLSPRTGSTRSGSKDDVSNVVYVRRWSGE
jgi:hypothetical protein